MNITDSIFAAIALLCIFLCVIIVWVNRLKTGKIISKMNKMLDAVMEGNFTETMFDESTLSALETRLSRHLSKCMISSKNLLAEKDKIKELISDISHQTKTPIANILLYSQLLGEYELPGDCRACVKALSSQAEKLNFLIGALVKTSRLETGIITVSPVIEPVQKLQDAVAEQIRFKADAKQVTVTVADTAAIACFDLKWTAEAIYNVVDNAVKYTPAGRNIMIRTAVYELFCRIDIIDEGIGIAEEEQNKIFLRFYRSRAAAEQEGVGIGLFLTREILSAQGGYIKVQSEVGKGSVFSVFLPKG
jgi:two-component system phosphate regulon sensor histidine kinase PhoR